MSDLMETRVPMTPIKIPDDLDFADLRLARDPDGMASFDTSVIERFEVASGLEPGFFMSQPEDALSSLLTQWYRVHLAAGGVPDPVQEDLITEVKAEDAAGQKFSVAAGRA